MTTYVLSDDTGAVVGPYATIAEAQIEASARSTAAATGNPTWTLANTATIYTCIDTKEVTRNFNGITCCSSTQKIVRRWTISPLTNI